MIECIKSKIKPAILSMVFVLGLALSVSVPIYAQNIDNSLSCGASIEFERGANCPTTTGGPVNQIERLIRNIVDILSTIVGIVAVIMIIIGGFKYITSAGDSNNVASAKNTIIYALVGLIIVALAQVIVRFVLGAATRGS